MEQSGRRPKYRLSELAFDAYFSEEIDSCTGCNAGGKSAEGIADAKDHKGPYCFGAAVESGVHGFPTRYIHVRDRLVASRTCDNHRERHRSESKNLATGLMLNETSARDDDAARTTCGRCQCAALSSVGLASGARTNSASAAT
jgi:hypothetical protein